MKRNKYIPILQREGVEMLIIILCKVSISRELCGNGNTRVGLISVSPFVQWRHLGGPVEADAPLM